MALPSGNCYALICINTVLKDEDQDECCNAARGNLGTTAISTSPLPRAMPLLSRWRLVMRKKHRDRDDVETASDKTHSAIVPCSNHQHQEAMRQSTWYCI